MAAEVDHGPAVGALRQMKALAKGGERITFIQGAREGLVGLKPVVHHGSTFPGEPRGRAEFSPPPIVSEQGCQTSPTSRPNRKRSMSSDPPRSLPRVLADGPVAPT